MMKFLFSFPSCGGQHLLSPWEVTYYIQGSMIYENLREECPQVTIYYIFLHNNFQMSLSRLKVLNKILKILLAKTGLNEGKMFLSRVQSRYLLLQKTQKTVIVFNWSLLEFDVVKSAAKFVIYSCFPKILFYKIQELEFKKTLDYQEAIILYDIHTMSFTTFWRSKFGELAMLRASWATCLFG